MKKSKAMYYTELQYLYWNHILEFHLRDFYVLDGYQQSSKKTDNLHGFVIVLDKTSQFCSK